MGREASADLVWGDQSGASKLILEADVLILRGAVRGRLARSGLGPAAVEGDDLVLATPQGPLRARLGAREAALWLKALAKPPPSLAQKLGVSPDRPVLVLGSLLAADPALAAALEGCCGPGAVQVLAVLTCIADLEAAHALADQANLPLWALAVKGKASPLPDAHLRVWMRARAWVDTKSCAVSAQLSATRWQKRKA